MHSPDFCVLRSLWSPCHRFSFVFTRALESWAWLLVRQYGDALSERSCVFSTIVLNGKPKIHRISPGRPALNRWMEPSAIYSHSISGDRAKIFDICETSRLSFRSLIESANGRKSFRDWRSIRFEVWSNNSLGVCKFQSSYIMLLFLIWKVFCLSCGLISIQKVFYLFSRQVWSFSKRSILIIGIFDRSHLRICISHPFAVICQ